MNGDDKGADPTINGGPTKRFFVSMLTRDIELMDALLDLIDNSIDGAMRQRRGRLDEDKPYEGFEAKVSISPERFEIKDNCGGIPKEDIDHAFMLGRPDIDRDSDLPTVGMYGIGMKRAIFKMGRDAKVQTRSSDGAFTVHYTPEWLDEKNNDWELPYTETADDLSDTGTYIVVEKLLPSIQRNFQDDSSFLQEFRDLVSKHYGYIMDRGFGIIINGLEIEPAILKLHALENQEEGFAGAIAPYFFSGIVSDVEIDVWVGFYRPPPKASDIEAELETSISSDEAGITVICNDRVVLHNDRSRTTGWGEINAPKYHNQFSSIAGVAIFTSNNAAHLPLRTTKRGLEVDNEAYYIAKKYLVEGITKFTSFTNKWKGVEEQTLESFKQTKRIGVKEFRNEIEPQMKKVRGMEARFFSPQLPTPPVENPFKRISFVRPVEEVRFVAELLFDDPNHNPSDVGARCFDEIKGRAKK